MNTHNINLILEELIKLYIFNINDLYSKLVDCLETDKLYEINIRREKKIPLKGRCEKYSLEYSFHGVGCYISTEYIEVDFDFDDNGKLETFNTWKLWCFVTDNNLDKKFDIFKDRKFLNNSLEVYQNSTN
ncbi:DUF6896 domain-containing protein [Aliarcobacter butzleri]|uniref:DUF6896 domain-containing protein n=1 Tax=Aliarcobacter butzleri TaxID=28197 RepID=UPI00344D8AFC